MSASLAFRRYGLALGIAAIFAVGCRSASVNQGPNRQSSPPSRSFGSAPGPYDDNSPPLPPHPPSELAPVPGFSEPELPPTPSSQRQRRPLFPSAKKPRPPVQDETGDQTSSNSPFRRGALNFGRPKSIPATPPPVPPAELNSDPVPLQATSAKVTDAGSNAAASRFGQGPFTIHSWPVPRSNPQNGQPNLPAPSGDDHFAGSIPRLLPVDP
jgi:hypothetical protein